MRIDEGVGQMLISPELVQAKVAELGARLTHDYEGRSLTLVIVLKGAAVFGCDLMRQIRLPLRVEFLQVASYGAGTTSTGTVTINQPLTGLIAGQDVVVVEDIIDTGNTASFLIDYISAMGPASLRLCALLDKPGRRQVPIKPDYWGFVISDHFVVGNGLDLDEYYRNVPGIGIYAGAKTDQA